jgi:hypothetical protein
MFDPNLVQNVFLPNRREYIHFLKRQSPSFRKEEEEEEEVVVEVLLPCCK